MQQELPFDPNVYFDIAAKNLLKNLGSKALDYADIALRKMKDTGNETGFEMWTGIHQRMALQMLDGVAPQKRVIN